MSRPQRISVLGATGSIGLSTLDVVQRHPDRYEAFALTGFSRLAELEALCLRHRPVYAVVPEQAAAIALQGSLAAAVSAPGCCSASRRCAKWPAHPKWTW